MTLSNRNLFKYFFFIGLLVFFILLVYANSFHAPFIFDDYNAIVKNNPKLQVNELTFTALKNAAVQSASRNRPLASITLALNYYFGGVDTFGYHVVNVVIHLLTGVCLFFLMIKILEHSVGADGKNGPGLNAGQFLSMPGLETLPTVRDVSNGRGLNQAREDNPLSGKGRRIVWIAFFSTLIWLIHPVQTNAVTYIVQRMTSLSALFYLFSLLMYVHGRTLMEQGRLKCAAGFLAGCFLAGVCAILSKESAATLPFFILLIEGTFFQNLRFSRAKTILTGGLVAIIIFCAAAFFFLGPHPLDRILAGYGKWGFTLAERVMTECRVIACYAGLMVFPHPDRLMLDYDYPISRAFIYPATTALSLIMILGLFFTAFYSYSRKRKTVIGFCLLWFLGNLVIESSVIGIELIYEHRLYLPSMMIFLLLVYLGDTIISGIKTKQAIVAGIVLILSFWTIQRNQTWRDDVGFWKDAVVKAPQDARPLQNIAYALQQKERHEKAVLYYQKSLQLEEDPAAFYNMGISLGKMGFHLEAVMAYKKANQQDYDATDLHGKLAYELTMLGEFNEAMKHYQQAIAVDPGNRKAKDDLNALSDFLRRCQTAQNCTRMLGQQYPDTPELQFKMAFLLEGERKIKKAIAGYQKTLSLMPESDRELYLMTLNHLATCFLMVGDMDQAMPLFSKGARLAPGDFKFHYQLAALNAYKGDAEAAFAWLEKAVEKGFGDADRLASDTRFSALRSELRFKQLINEMEAGSE